MKVPVYDLEGNEKGEVELPKAFQEEIRPDVIRKAFKVFMMNNRHPYGAHPLAGKRYAAESWGVGYGRARVPRLSNGRAVLAPMTVGGRRAHPPKVEKNWKRKINVKEKRLALRSALSATRIPELVKARGHRIPDGKPLPIVVVDDFETLNKTKDVLKVLEALGLSEDLARVRKKIRAGKGKMRGRKYRVPKSLLIVVSKYQGIQYGVSNIPGVDLVPVKHLNISYLAPGGNPGRLTLFTESALKELEGWP